MPILLASAALTAIAKELAARGLDLLSGVYRGQNEEDVNNVTGHIKEATGIDVQDVVDNKLTEQQWMQLKEFELGNQEGLLKARETINPNEIELELERLAVQDRQKARETQTKRDDNEDPMIRRFTYYYAYLITVLTFLFIGSVVILPIYFCKGAVDCKAIPDQSWQIINTVLGFLLGVGLSAIIQFYYGSSQGSRDKDKQVRELNKQLPASGDVGQGGE